MPETTQKTDLSALRIHRDGPSVTTTSDTATRSMKPFIWIVVAIVVLAILGYFASGLFSSPETVETGVVAMVSPSQMNSVLTASGYVVASRKAAVGSKGTGRLVWLGVEEGSLVKKNQIIGRLEDADVEAALNEAQASLAAAQATLQSAQAGFANADSNFRRDKVLYKANLISSSDFTNAESAYKQAQALVNTDAANVLLAERGVQAAQVQIEFTNIRAPFDGTVLTKDADVGDIMTPFGAAAGSRADIVSLADMSSLDAEVDVSESNLEQVHVGQPCEISLDAVPEKQYRGVVHMIVPTADRSKATVLTKVDFQDIDSRVLPEMSLKVQFLKDSTVVDSSGPKLTVPAAAVVSKNGSKVVFFIQGDHVVETPVTLGASVGNGLEVKSGLKDGDKVVLSPADKLRTGTKVKAAE
ncbi:MAG TPA: efflux RND transporter periplasmic adaptor subunit [Candidatus Kapabacteria bacterium]|nr:efflux RND transporter periplasmic adaptor subunit [Candidatus Kapabacteria bacterium]